MRDKNAQPVFMLSANDLHAGHVVYLTSRGDWSRDFTQGARIQAARAEEVAAAAPCAFDAAQVLDIIPIEIDREQSAPKKMRARMRLAGPSVQFGKPNLNEK